MSLRNYYDRRDPLSMMDDDPFEVEMAAISMEIEEEVWNRFYENLQPSEPAPEPNPDNVEDFSGAIITSFDLTKPNRDHRVFDPMAFDGGFYPSIKFNPGQDEYREMMMLRMDILMALKNAGVDIRSLDTDEEILAKAEEVFGPIDDYEDDDEDD